MSCERFEKTLLEAAAGDSSPELEAHLARCEPCRAALAAERALIDRIDTELEGSLATPPSSAFLPGVRRRVAEAQAQKGSVRRWWPVPALATLAAVLVAGHFVGEARRDPTPTASHRPAAPRAVAAPEGVEPPGLVPEVPAPSTRPELPVARSARLTGPEERIEVGVAPARPRVFVPAEDERAVRRLARRLRGRAARAPVVTPEVQGPFDFTLEPVEDRSAVVSLDDRVLQGDEPVLEEPLSFDRTNEKAGRET